MTEQRMKRIAILCVAIFTLNIFDAAMTYMWLINGLATEANPLMQSLWSIHPTMFLLGKGLIAGFSIMILWSLKHQFIAIVGIYLCAFVYALIAGYHIYGVLLHLR